MESAAVKEEHEMKDPMVADNDEMLLSVASEGCRVMEESNCDKSNGNEELLHPSNVPRHQKQKIISLAQPQGESMETNEGRCQQDVEEHHLDSDKIISDLKKQLQQTVIAQSASEELIAELRVAVSNAEHKSDQTLMELVEAKKKWEEDMKEKDRKYAELDVKLTKLQKRAKQRIQEVQKEKEDTEGKLAAALERASKETARSNSLQNDLERVRAQAGEALRSLDGERQQLRSANIKQKEVIEDLQHTLEAQEVEYKEAQSAISEKDQVINELTDKMMEMEKNHGALVLDSKSKNQQLIADLEAQLGEAIQERMKSAESVSSLQAELAKKESHIAELDAASSGEVIRLMAAVDSNRAELARMEKEHAKEKKIWETALEATKIKIEEAEKTHVQRELSSAKEKGQLDSDLQGLQQSLRLAQAELFSCKEQATLLEKEFSAYKARAHSLLQKKEAELSAAKDTEKLAVQEAALKEAQSKAAAAGVERDNAVKALKEAMVMHDTQLAARSMALMDAQQKIRELAANVESSKARMLIEEEQWQNRLDDVTQSWQEKYKLLTEKNASQIVLEQEITLLKDKCTQLQEEDSSFRAMANKMLESKDQEISRLLEEIGEQQKILSDVTQVSREDSLKSGRNSEDISLSAGEQQILMLARQQAQREEELGQCQRHIQALQDEIVELEHENRLHAQQEAALKEELRNLDRSRKREGVDMTYLKNVILKLLETGEVEALLPVVATLLQFSRDELKKCQEVYNVVPETPAANSPTTLLSRFLFSKNTK